MAELARNLGIQVNTLHGWRQQFSSDPDSVFPGHGEQLGKDDEIRELKKQLRRVEQERDILKRAVVYFSDEKDLVPIRKRGGEVGGNLAEVLRGTEVTTLEK